MRNKPVKILIIVLLAATILLLLSAWWMATFLMMGKRQTLDEAMAWQTNHYDTSFYQAIEKTDYTVTGHEGYILHTELLRNPEPTGKYIILSHGITDNRFGSLKYVRMYLDFDYNCIIYDLRGHGPNQADIRKYCASRRRRQLRCEEKHCRTYQSCASLPQSNYPFPCGIR